MGERTGGRTDRSATWLARWRRVAWLTGAGVLLGLLGPFGSYLDPGLWRRLGYWTGSIWLGAGLFAPCVAAFRRDDRSNLPRLARLMIMALAAGVVQAVITRMAALWLWPDLRRVGPGWGVWYLQVLLLGFASIVAPIAWRRHPPPKADEDGPLPLPAGPAATPVPASAAWPAAGRVTALQMEDHYVRVHAVGRSRLVHATLREALREVASIEGLQPHRSWWVARHAVRGIECSTRSMHLRLDGGLLVPVARYRVAILRAAGWLESPRTRAAVEREERTIGG